MESVTLDTLIGRAEITDVLHTYLNGLDSRNWDQVASLFTRPFHLQAEMLGIDREVQPEEYLALGPQNFLPGFSFTAHLCSNTRINLDELEAHLVTRLLACHHVQPEGVIRTDLLSSSADALYCNMHMTWEAWLVRQEGGGWLIRRMRMGVDAVEGDTAAFDAALTRSSTK